MIAKRAAELFERGVIHGVEYARALHNHGAIASAKQLAKRVIRDWFVYGVRQFDHGTECLRLGIGCFTEKQAGLAALAVCCQIDWVRERNRNWHGEFEAAQLPKPGDLYEVRARLKAYQLWLACGGLERALC